MSIEMLSDNRTVLVTGKARVEIRKDASPEAKVVGLADPGAVLKLKACAQDACRVVSGGVDGWIPKTRIWGVGPERSVQIRRERAARLSAGNGACR